MAWFNWNGTDSRSMGLIVQEYPPIVMPAERVESIAIPGRAGSLTRSEGDAIYESYLKTFTVANSRLGDAREIGAWLRGSGELIIGSEPDYRYFARVVKEASLKRQHPSVYSGSVSFLVEPYKGLADGDDDYTATITDASMTLYNVGDVPASPILTITGTGLLEVTINGDDGSTIYVQTGESGTGAIVDVDAMQVTDLTGEENFNRISSVSANGFVGLRLIAGNNVITWGENVTGLTITPRWRWL